MPLPEALAKRGFDNEQQPQFHPRLSLWAGRDTTSWTTVVGAALAAMLVVFALASALNGASALPEEPAALTLVGP